MRKVLPYLLWGGIAYLLWKSFGKGATAGATRVPGRSSVSTGPVTSIVPSVPSPQDPFALWLPDPTGTSATTPPGAVMREPYPGAGYTVPVFT